MSRTAAPASSGRERPDPRRRVQRLDERARRRGIKGGVQADAALLRAQESALRELAELNDGSASQSVHDADEEDGFDGREPPQPYEYDGPNPRLRADSKGKMLADLLQSGLEKFGYPRPDALRPENRHGATCLHRYEAHAYWRAGTAHGFPGLINVQPGGELPPNPRDELLQGLYVAGRQRFGDRLLPQSPYGPEHGRAHDRGHSARIDMNMTRAGASTVAPAEL